MKKIKLVGVILLVYVGCQKVEDNNKSKLMSFVARIEVRTQDLETRTILGGISSDANRSILWEYNDQVYVTNGTSSAKFTNQTEGTSDLAILEGSLAQGINYYAAYPYEMVMGYSSAGFTIELPANQEYYKDGISSGSFPMVAQCQDGVLNFKNLCGIFVLQLIGDKTISSITFSGKDASGNAIPVAGYGSVALDYLQSPYLSMENSSVTSVTLKSSEGVCLNTSLPTTFHIVLPVGTYNTFMLVIKATDGTAMIVESEKSLEIKRSNRTTAVPLTYSEIIHYQDLNESGETANCYIISEPGYYQFSTTKGNSRELIDGISSAEVLWESFGTDVTPSIGDLISNVFYCDDVILFSTSSLFLEGNAVIVVKDALGTILWSWHIWLTDKPEEQVYYNNAGTIMDRNIGATSATPGDVGALGLLYQWGRKDPFLGSSSISESVVAKSTGIWPSSVESSSSTGTVEYVTSHPTTFVYESSSSSQGDWHYASRDDTLWTSYTKSVFDPCPAGWRVPAGIDNDFWTEVLGTSSAVGVLYDDSNEGINFSGKFGSDQIIWYPASGVRSMSDGHLFGVTTFGRSWTSEPVLYVSCTLYFDNNGTVDSWQNGRSHGYPVRCQKIHY